MLRHLAWSRGPRRLETRIRAAGRDGTELQGWSGDVRQDDRRVRYSAKSKREFLRRMRDDEIADLSDHMGISSYDVHRFQRKDPGREIWSFLESRGRLGELPAALRTMDRADLADELEADAIDHRADPGGDGGAESTGRPRPRHLAGAAVGVAIVTVGGVALAIHPWSTRPGGTEPDPHQTVSQPTGALPSVVEPVVAKIARTWDVDTGKFVGVRSYADPGPNGKGTEVGSYAEGDTIRIVCQLRHGRTISDAPWEDRERSSPVWDRLAGPNPQWVPDLYVDLPKVSGDTPPRGLPVCP